MFLGRFDAGPTSTTLAQRQNDIGPACCVCWILGCRRRVLHVPAPGCLYRPGERPRPIPHNHISIIHNRKAISQYRVSPREMYPACPSVQTCIDRRKETYISPHRAKWKETQTSLRYFSFHAFYCEIIN